MALINCPECQKQISDTTASCPHCGYKLSVEQAPSAPVPTKIGATKTEASSGMVYLTIGILGIIASIFALIFVLPLGILSMIGSIVLTSVGSRKISGSQECYCPYCGKLGTIGKSEQAYVCLVCKKRSIRNGEYLKPL